jgi:uncharacterized protein (TIGR02099 family)
LRLLRTVLALGVGALVLFALLLLSLRFWLLPNIESYRGYIVAALSRSIGQDVQIGRLEAGWDGWNPTLSLTDVSIVDANGRRVLNLPRVNNSVSWRSLFVMDLRLRMLEIERPQLDIRRDGQGKIHIAGLVIDPAERGGESGAADWLLRQRSVVVRDALIFWQDDLRQAPQLVLDRVNFRLENSGSRHRFGLSGVPPEELAAPLDLRGELKVRSFKDWTTGSARFYLRLDYADLAAWREWLPLPIDVSSGKGAVRFWVSVDHAMATEVVADLELKGLVARLRSDLPELAVDRVSGRLGWRRGAEKTEVFGQSLALAGREASLPSADFSWSTRGSDPATRDNELTLSRVTLEPLSSLVRYLPLDASLREEVARYSPRGFIDAATVAWRGDAAIPKTYSVKAKLRNIGATAVAPFPGVHNLSGELEATEARGSFQLASRQLALHFPNLFEQPLLFDALQANVIWGLEKDGLELKIEDASFSNNHATGTASVEYRALPEGPGFIDATARLTRADGRYIYEYLPMPLNASVREWVQRSILGGIATDARFKLKGNLREFPFVGDKGGTFQVDARFNEGVLDYAPRWPRLEHVRGDLHFHGTRVTINSEAAETLGVSLGKVVVTIPDMLHTRLLIEGEAYDQTKDFLQYVAASPVADMIGHMTNNLQATGNGRLNLKLELPLAKLSESRVAGEYEFLGNRLHVDEDVPDVDQLNGKVVFTESDMRAGLTAGDVLGGPATIQLSTPSGVLHARANGTLDLGLLRKRYNLPLAAQASGKTDWQLALEIDEGKTEWLLDSSLRGAVIDLPAPFSKTAASELPLRVAKGTNDGGEEFFRASYGKVAQIELLRKAATRPGEKPPLDRAAVAFGEGPAEADKPGLWLSGKLDQLDLDQWLALKIFGKGGDDATSGVSLPIGGGDLTIGNLLFTGRRFHNLRVSAGVQDRNWKMQIQGNELAGSFNWNAGTKGDPSGKLTARLQKVDLPSSEEPKKSEARDDNASKELPSLDVVAESFRYKDKDLGRLELQAHPEDSQWNLDHFALVSAEGSIRAAGHWRTAGKTQATQLDVNIEAKDAGAFLKRFGYLDAIKAAPSTLKGKVSWEGSPQSLDYATLSGKIALQSGKGQFSQLDPGIGKLLGVLSLQALPRRISLDFRDVFSQGFAFDEITADVKIAQGVMSTQNLRISGPAARVELSGEANLVHETQSLRVKVLPSLSSSAAIGAALFNPLLGGAVYLGSKVLKDPIDQIFAYEYRITGSWSDPHVEKYLAATARQ